MHQPFPSRPPDSQASLSLALSHHRAGRLAEAEAIYRRILKEHPAHARAAHLLGLAAHQDGRLSEALALIRHSIALDPSPADFHSNLGTVLAALGQKSEAEAAFRQALSINADYPDAAINLANVLREQHRLDEAAEVGTEALRRWPQNADVHNALGTILERQQRVREALACFSQAVSLRPEYAQAKMNRAMALLALGDFEHGWREYEARLSLPGPTQQRRWPTPRWDGTSPAGRTILLHTEGGLGNVMQFARFAQRLAGRGAKVILEAPPPLQRILRSLKGVQVMAMGQKLPPHEVQAPLCSLPMLLGAEYTRGAVPPPRRGRVELSPLPRVSRLGRFTRGYSPAALWAQGNRLWPPLGGSRPPDPHQRPAAQGDTGKMPVPRFIRDRPALSGVVCGKSPAMAESVRCNGSQFVLANL